MFYATISYGKLKPSVMPDISYLLPASSWARGMRKDGSLPTPRLPNQITHVAADCGGFVASRIWGDYKYSPAQYVDWLNRFPVGILKWAATMDYCCELPLTLGQQKAVVERQTKTTLNAWLFWQEYRGVGWAWIPTIQGWEVEDYIRHAQELKPLIEQMQAHYQAAGNPHFRVGIGTLCARASTRMIQNVVLAVQHELPEVKFHLWGVKLSFLRSRIHIPSIVSFDSAAWDRGGMGGEGLDIRNEYRAMGITQREHAFRYLLPEYLSRVNEAISSPKQMILWEANYEIR